MKVDNGNSTFIFTCFLNIVLFCIYEVYAQRPFGYCVDAICSEPIAHGKTVQKYFAKESGMLSFEPNMEVKIYVKNVGEKAHLFGVEIDGKRGYVPKRMIQETRTLRTVTFPVHTDFLVLSTALNQASSHFGSTTGQPPFNPHISHTVSDPGLSISHTDAGPGLSFSHMGADPGLSTSHTDAGSGLSFSHTGADPGLSTSHTDAGPGLSFSHTGANPGLSTSHTDAGPGLSFSHTGADPGLSTSHTDAGPGLSFSHTGADPGLSTSHTGADPGLSTSHTVGDPQFSQSSPLPLQTADVQGSQHPHPSFTPSDDPSVYQSGGQPALHSQSVLSNVQRLENTELGSSIGIQSNLVSPSFSANVHPTSSMPSGVNPDLMNINTHQQGHIHNSPVVYGSLDMHNTDHLKNSIPPPGPLVNNILPPPSPPVLTDSNAFHGESFPSSEFNPDSSFMANSQSQGMNAINDHSSVHSSIGDSSVVQMQDSPSVDSVSADTSSGFATESQDPDEHTSSLLSKYQYSEEPMTDALPSNHHLDSSSPIASSQEGMKADFIHPNPTKTTHNTVDSTSTASPEVDGASEFETMNQKQAEAGLDDPHSKTEESDVEKDHPLSDSETEEGFDDKNIDDEEEDSENNEKRDEENEGDDEFSPKTQNEETTDITPIGSMEDNAVDSSPSTNDMSAISEIDSELPDEEQTDELSQTTSVKDGGSSPDPTVSIDTVETSKFNEHSEVIGTRSFPDSGSNSISDSNSDSSLAQDSKNTSSVSDAVTEPSIFESADEFAQSSIATDYSAKPTRSILQDDDSPNTSDIGSQDNLNDDEIFHQDETVYSKSDAEENISSTDSETLSNFVAALRASLDQLISLCPEPLYSYVMGVSAFGISSRALVFTTLMSIPCLFLFLAAFFLKESSKEHIFVVKLTEAEHQLYLASTERNLLREDVTSLKEKITELEESLEVERNLITTLQSELQDYEQANQSANIEQKENLSSIQSLEKKVDDYEQKVSDLKRLINEEREKTEEALRKLQVEENVNDDLDAENENLKDSIATLQSEKESLVMEGDSYKEKVSQLESYCNDLRQEIDYHSGRATELSDQTASYLATLEELERSVLTKDNEIEDLRSVISNLDVLQKMKGSGDSDDKGIEDKLTALMDISAIQNKLTKAENEKESVLEKLKEKTKDCDEMKVDLLELKSEVETLKMHKERAVEDRNQAQSELSVLEKYFKEKELQLQMELGTQLTVRQQKEMDVSQAQRHILQLEEENASYKSQVSTLKLEIEETERNLKKQIAAQEESAHKNWVAARTAERKAEEAKQEVAQFRQRITLLERERESWTNSSQSDIIKPVPHRISDSLHDVSQGSNTSGEFKPEMMLPRLLPMMPMMPPPPLSVHGPPPPFMPPFHPMVPPPPPRPPPWHLMQDKNLDFDRRNTPSDFESSSSSRRHHTPPEFDSSRRHHTPPDFESSRRHHTPPDFESSRRHHTPPDFESSRRHHTPPEFNSSRRHYSPPDFDSYGSSRMPHTPPFYGREGEKRSSPVEGSSHSRSSSPLPDFHNVPPPVSRRRDAPPPMHARYPGPPPLGMPTRRDSDFIPSRSGKIEDKGNDNFRGDP